MLSTEDILESLAEGLIAVDAGLIVRAVNQSAEKICEMSRAMALGKALPEVFRKDPRVCEIVENTIKGGRLITEYEYNLHRRFSGTIPVGITTSQVFDPEGNIIGAAVLFKDLSGIKSLEAGSLRKERLAYIGTFAASLAHEIKNPLTGIRGAAQLLSRRVKEEGLKEYTSVIMSEADRLNSIINDLLDFARPAELKRRPINIHMVLDSVLLLLRESSPETALLKEYDPSLPPVSGDERQLTQVFLNIVKNAKEALASKRGKGVVNISTRMITDFYLVDEKSPGGKMASIEVKDNGCGIKEEDLEKIFTPFFTTKAKGSGLGMPISLKIIKEHGGLLKIDSIPGRGTTVTVLLPLAEETTDGKA